MPDENFFADSGSSFAAVDLSLLQVQPSGLDPALQPRDNGAPAMSSSSIPAFPTFRIC